MLKLDEETFKYNPNTWKDLSNKILNGKIILFIGAGLSHDSGLPDWAGLIERLCKKNGKVQFDHKLFETGRSKYLQECANKIEKNLKEEELVASIRDIICNPQSNRDFTFQERLIRLIYSKGGVIITTNYDCFLETAADQIVGHQTHAYPYGNERGDSNRQSLLDILNLKSEDHEFTLNGQLHIFKLHGDINSKKLVLSKNSYDIAYRESYTKGILSQLYNQDILFLGCSLSDPFFLSEWRGQQAKGEWFVLYPTHHSPDEIKKALDLENKMDNKHDHTENPINPQILSLNIRAIYYKIDNMKDKSKQHSECMSKFLSTLERQKSLFEPKRIRTVGDLIDAEADDNIDALQFCAWRNGEEYLKELLEPKRFKSLKTRIKKVVFSSDYPNADISEKTFKGWTQLNEVQLCPNIKRIASKAFYGCSALKTIYTANEELNDYHIYNRLENINLIGESAFCLCKALEHIDFYKCKGLLDIPVNAFEECERLQTVSLPISLKNLGAQCFRDCISLKTLNWVDLNNLESIGQEAFTNCNNLSQIILPRNLEKLGNATFQNAKLAYLTGLDACKLEVIPEYAFKNCDKITLACFSNKVEIISRWAMAECDNLNTVVIPTSVKEIEANAFTNCKNLENVIFMGNAKIEIADNAFSQCSQDHQEEINRKVKDHRK